MKKKEYQKPELKIVAVESNEMLCVSGNINDWKLDNDDSGSDDWGSDESGSRRNNLWGGFED